MQTDDRREEWMGLGILLSEIRFGVWLENRSDSRLGMRVRRRISWHSLFNSGTMAQQACVEAFLSPFDMELKESYNSRDDIFKWLLIFSKLDGMYELSHAITDSSGLHMMRWVTENPLPRDWDDFLVWVDSYDSEIDMVGHDFSV